MRAASGWAARQPPETTISGATPGCTVGRNPRARKCRPSTSTGSPLHNPRTIRANSSARWSSGCGPLRRSIAKRPPETRAATAPKRASSAGCQAATEIGATTVSRRAAPSRASVVSLDNPASPPLNT
ncbi:hypothetical protein GCM10009539_51720 [Cryptosporangium japonicum]|uniref:Uncharacterized protein n=1 Tax=Cryptosporangium japonicum TaxID=80872 RepID=A0ABP3EDF8_9ACTN